MKQKQHKPTAKEAAAVKAAKVTIPDATEALKLLDNASKEKSYRYVKQTLCICSNPRCRIGPYEEVKKRVPVK